ncbi:MAG: transposase [Chloroflexi bacterium]|nr:transposase [Chloroflexota bacterium]
MPYNPLEHHRHSIRLKGYDYSQAGAYFITANTHLEQNLFGDMVGDHVQLNRYGHIAEQEWLQTAVIRKNIELDIFAIMPDHFHGILLILESHEGTAAPCPYARPGIYTGAAGRALTIEQFGKPTAGSLPTIMRSFKSAVTRRINQLRRGDGTPVWQRGYYEHVVRNDEDLNRIRQYILDNPSKEVPGYF